MTSDSDPDRSVGATLNTLLRAIQKMPRHRGLSFRGIEPSEAPMRAGALIVSPVLVATSLDLRIATENFRTDRLMAIFGPDGRVLGQHSQHPDEREVVFLPSSVYKIVETSDVDGMSVTIVEQLDLDRPADAGPWTSLEKIRDLINAHVPRAHQRAEVDVSSPGKFIGGLFLSSPIGALKAELATVGIGSDSVMWDHEPWQRADGARVLTRLSDGRIRSSLHERGQESEVEVFESEESAAQSLREKLMVLAKPGRIAAHHARDDAITATDLDGLAAEMTAMGFGEFVDFFISARANGTMTSSELVCLSFGDDGYRIWYRDMGKDYEILRTHDGEHARRVFIDETQRLVDTRYPRRTSS